MVFKASEVLIENREYVEGMTWYGWVHVSVDENLDMTLLGDGINLYGSSHLDHDRTMIRGDGFV